MSDDKGVEGTSTRGNEWEVVSLTASAYAAAPSVDEYQSGNVDNNLALSEDESARELFMSGHFVFPPAEHENLPIDDDVNKVQQGQFEEESNDPSPAYDHLCLEDEVSNKPEEEDWSLEGHPEAADVHGMQYLDEINKNFGEGKDTQGFNLAMDSATGLSSLSSQVEGSDVSEDEPLKGGEDTLPCEPWWKRHKVIIYSQSTGTTVILTVVVAAAIVGLFILGKRLRRVAASAS